MASLVVVGAFITLLILFQTKVFSTSTLYHETPLQWYEYTQMVLGSLLLPALYGLIIPFALKRDIKGKNMTPATLRMAAIIGGLSQLGAYALNQTSHLDCGDDCVLGVPSYSAINAMFVVGILVAVVAPVLLSLCKPKESHG